MTLSTSLLWHFSYYISPLEFLMFEPVIYRQIACSLTWQRLAQLAGFPFSPKLSRGRVHHKVLSLCCLTSGGTVYRFNLPLKVSTTISESSYLCFQLSCLWTFLIVVTEPKIKKPLKDQTPEVFKYPSWLCCCCFSVGSRETTSNVLVAFHVLDVSDVSDVPHLWEKRNKREPPQSDEWTPVYVSHCHCTQVTSILFLLLVCPHWT